MQRFLILLSAFLAAVTTLNAQSRRSPQHIRAAVVQKLGAQRAATLQPIIEHDAVAALSTPLMQNGEDGGFALISYSANTPVVLAYGDEPIDPTNISPEFLYLMKLYEEAIEAVESGPMADAAPALPEADETWPVISPMLTTTWNQGSPYYDQCPIFYNTSSRCVTGCVATAMAQVLNYYKMPKTMHGHKTYGYYVQKNDGTNVHVEHSFDFGATTFDWANMSNKYGTGNSTAQKQAVAKLMYACGVASGMHYSPDNSWANPWVADDAVNCFMDGLRAEHCSYSLDRIKSELQAGHPVMYTGSRSGGGSHCFVIDGCRSDGYLHCNMGWGGGSDGYYLPPNLCNYDTPSYLDVIYPSDYVPICTPIAALRNKFATASATAATTVEPGKWYVLWNAGRSGSPMSNGVGKEITNTSLLPEGTATSICAPQLVRFVANTASSRYYIQTGLGDYFGFFQTFGTGTTTSTSNVDFSLASIQPGYFSICQSNGRYLDTNGPGSTVVAWGNTAITDIYSNSSWQFFPVEFSDTDPSAGLGIGTGANFDATKYYTLKNTGYSQGYLVALGEDDAYPTLRGVTTDHSQGLYTGALYHDAPDVYNHGHYWQIVTEGNKQYLVNYGTGKYLANTGNQQSYVFTDQKTPINIVKMADGTFRFNTGTEENSFLCAATHLSNPAAFWTHDDAGSIWQVEETEVQRPYVAVQSVTLSAESTLLLSGRTTMITPTVLPADATNPNVTWTTSDASVATISTAGVVTAVGAGQATITVASADNPALTATFAVKVIGTQRKTSVNGFSEDEIYLLRNVGTVANPYSQGYLVATTDSAAHPTLRGVENIHPTQGCKNDDYKLAPDYLSPGSYWQIFADGADRYLYNIGVGKFLANTGDRTCYEFTDEPTPINIAVATNGTFLFNSGTEAYSYLCAATQLDNPAAFWANNDVGSYWSVEAVEGLDAVLSAGTSVVSTDLFTAAARTIHHLVQAISRFPSGKATLEDADRNARFILHQRKR